MSIQLVSFFFFFFVTLLELKTFQESKKVPSLKQKVLDKKVFLFSESSNLKPETQKEK